MASTTSTSAAGAKSRFLDLRALSALENLQFVTRQSIEGAFGGRHRSRRQGGAGEFADYREYYEGEDLRRLDWKVLARTGRAYTRLYQDETNLRALLAIDASSSMKFGARSAADGTGSKLEYVQFLATALSQIISRRQDQVGLAVVANKLESVMSPGATRQHMSLLQGAIEKLEPRPASQLQGSLRKLFEISGRRGVLVFLSDFLFEDLEAAFADIRLFRHRGWEVILIHVVHPDEEKLPEGIGFRFVGLEGEGSLDASPGDLRAAYEERFGNHLEMVRSLATGAGCDYRRASTAVSYLQMLRGFLTERTG